jgi:acetyltransferase-like isoleucine patch superfamily enzyme
MAGTLRRLLTAVVALAVPRPFKSLLLNALGHRVHRGARIGTSLLLVDRLWLADGTRIGSWNYLRCDRVLLRRGAYLGRLNFVRGPLSLHLRRDASLGNLNRVTRAPRPISYGPARLKLGVLSKLTSGHAVDCMQSVLLGDYTTVAGKGSQLWTHGYLHEPAGPGRARIDGSIRIGNNVYVGSGCIITMGVRIGDAVTVGSLSSVSKSIDAPGLYVSQPLRFLDRGFEEATRSLEEVPRSRVGERVFLKRWKPPEREEPR